MKEALKVKCIVTMGRARYSKPQALRFKRGFQLKIK